MAYWRCQYILFLLELIGFDSCSENHPFGLNIPEGGSIELYEGTGRPTGLLKERAVEPVVQALSNYKDHASRVKFIKQGIQACVASGLTTVQTNDESCLVAYQELQKMNKLPLRILLTPNQQEIEHGLVRVVDPFESNCSTAGITQSRLAIKRVKLFADGSLGADTAAIKLYQNTGKDDKAASSNENYKGILIYHSHDLEERITLSTQRGFGVEIHAIGDAAAEQVLTALQTVVDRKETLYRPILTHCQILSEELIDKMAQLNVIASVQPSFVPTDMAWIHNRIYPQQMPFAYAWKSLLQSKVIVAGGSDAPIEDPSPFIGMYDAIFRTNRHRISTTHQPAPDSSIFGREQCLSFAEALWIYTIGGALAAGWERYLGCIEQSYVGDIVVVDPRIVEDPTLLHGLTPYLVLVGGQVVYDGLEKASEMEIQSVLPTILKAGGNSVFDNESELCQGMKLIDSQAPFIPGRGSHFNSLSSSRRGFCSCCL